MYWILKSWKRRPRKKMKQLMQIQCSGRNLIIKSYLHAFHLGIDFPYFMKSYQIWVTLFQVHPYFAPIDYLSYIIMVLVFKTWGELPTKTNIKGNGQNLCPPPPLAGKKVKSRLFCLFLYIHIPSSCSELSDPF